MMALGTKIRKMVLVSSLGLVETFIKVNTGKTRGMDKDEWNGPMAVHTKENGRKASSMVGVL